MLTSSLIRSFPSCTSSLRLLHTLRGIQIPHQNQSVSRPASTSANSNLPIYGKTLPSLSIPSSLFPSRHASSSSSSSVFSSSLIIGVRNFATAKTKSASESPKKTKKTKKVKAKKPKAEKKAAVAKRPRLTDEQKAIKKERVAKKKQAVKHNEDRLKALFVRSIQPAAKRALSPAFQYIAEVSPNIRLEKKISQTEAATEAAKRYKELADAQKAKYVKKYEEQKAALKAEWDKYDNKYGYPERPLSSYVAYATGRRAELKASNPSLTGIAETAKQISIEWNKLSKKEQENNKFFSKAKYETDLKEYREKKQKIDDKLLVQFNSWKEARKAKKAAEKVKKEAAIESS